MCTWALLSQGGSQMLCSTNYYGNNTNILILQVNVTVSCLVLFNVRIIVLIQYQYNNYFNKTSRTSSGTDAADPNSNTDIDNILQ